MSENGSSNGVRKTFESWFKRGDDKGGRGLSIEDQGAIHDAFIGFLKLDAETQINYWQSRALGWFENDETVEHFCDFRKIDNPAVRDLMKAHLALGPRKVNPLGE